MCHFKVVLNTSCWVQPQACGEATWLIRVNPGEGHRLRNISPKGPIAPPDVLRGYGWCVTLSHQPLRPEVPIFQLKSPSKQSWPCLRL
jgi:hypothetical protein